MGGEMQSNMSDGAGTNTYIMQPGQVNNSMDGQQMAEMGDGKM